MHDKFMVVDDRFVFCGTANWTPTDLVRNSNNFVVMDSPEVAADFSAEFEQMYEGVFGNNKSQIDNGRKYQVGDTEVEVWFSPNEDAMGRIREVLGEAQESVRFTIFAFTKNEVGSDLIRKQAEFLEADLAEGIASDGEGWRSLDHRSRRSVAGVVDKSQLHSNGQYHEVYRLLAEGVPMRLDGNDNSRQPGDYQAGGGRLHSKTMVIDANGDNPTVITGSFNWSASATSSNDEFLLVMRGPRVAKLYDEYFERLWAGGLHMGESSLANGDIDVYDIMINEVHWYGVNEADLRDDEDDRTDDGPEVEDLDGFDEFIELRNNTDRDIRLDMWQISNADDVVVGLPPGSLIPAGGTFLIADHTLETYVDGEPQDDQSALLTADLVVNSFNDNRQHRLYIKDGSMELFLREPELRGHRHCRRRRPGLRRRPQHRRLPGALHGAAPGHHRRPGSGGLVRLHGRRGHGGREPGLQEPGAGEPRGGEQPGRRVGRSGTALWGCADGPAERPAVGRCRLCSSSRSPLPRGAWLGPRDRSVQVQPRIPQGVGGLLGILQPCLFSLRALDQIPEPGDSGLCCLGLLGGEGGEPLLPLGEALLVGAEHHVEHAGGALRHGELGLPVEQLAVFGQHEGKAFAVTFDLHVDHIGLAEAPVRGLDEGHGGSSPARRGPAWSSAPRRRCGRTLRAGSPARRRRRLGGRRRGAACRRAWPSPPA